MPDEDTNDVRHVPVLIGCGETIDRPATLDAAREPLALMADAARLAESDCGAALLGLVDSLDVVNLVSWRYRDIVHLLADRLGVRPTRAAYAEVGGESPVRLIHEAALRIARGESAVALVVGAEAQYSAAKARRAGVTLPWTPFAKDGPKVPSGRDIVHPLAAAYGASQPTYVYPFYDMASATAWGQSPAEALAESGRAWAGYAAVAANNPTSWKRQAPDADAIVAPTEDNRLIAWPYTKRMVANPMVNQGAAVIVASLAAARAAGVSEERIVHIVDGAAASDTRDFMARDQFARSHAQDVVLERMRALVPAGYDAVELYSCFPCVPKMARRTLGIAEGAALTVTGGLSFFGAPLSDYMLHAAGAMMRRLRDSGGVGLLYGQGEFVTKHHALALSKAAAGPIPTGPYDLTAMVDARRGTVPPTVVPCAGPATLESATVIYGRDGEVDHGVVLLRTPNGARTIAAVTAEDEATLALITASGRSPVGRTGKIVEGEGEWMRWTAR
jgi:acetyl-CoA C-acetyltransferase